MKQGWKNKLLGDISEIIYGYTEKASFEEIGPKFLRITDIQNNKVDWESVPYCKLNDADFQKYKLNDGDIVFARTGATTGKSYLIKNPPKSVFASYLIKVHLKNNELLPKFLYLFFQTNSYWNIVNSGISGSAQGGFNATKLSKMVVPVPPIPEQKRIVAILEKAFAAIDRAKANAEKNLANAKELFESYLNKIFANPGEDWEEKNLDECFKLKSGDGLTAKNMNQEGNIPVYGGNGIAGYHNEFNLSGNNVIVGRVGALCGNARNINENIWLTDNAFKIVNYKYKFDSSFLTYLLNYKNLKNYARQAAQPVISNSSLQNVKLQFPLSLTEQKQIVEELDEIFIESKKLETIYQQKLADLEELKKSILQKAFEGEL